MKEEIISRTAQKINMPEELVEEVFNSYFYGVHYDLTHPVERNIGKGVYSKGIIKFCLSPRNIDRYMKNRPEFTDYLTKMKEQYEQGHARYEAIRKKKH